MNYKYNITGIINCESVDDAVDILHLILNDFVSTCKVNISNDDLEVTENNM